MNLRFAYAGTMIRSALGHWRCHGYPICPVG